MPKGRAVPSQPPSPKELEHLERRAALLSLDPALMRAWASRWIPPELNTTALADHASLLESMHEARLRDDFLPRDARLASARWLAERGDVIAAEVLARLEAVNEP